MAGFFNRVNKNFQTLKGEDFIRKIILFTRDKYSFRIFRKIKSYYHFKRSDVHLGRNVRISGLCANISVGANVEIYSNTIFEFGPYSKLTIGNNTLFSYGVLLAVTEEIKIGDNVQIGEYTSIRDSTHRHDVLDKPMKLVADICKPIIIGNDVWIGRGCIIFPGTIIEDGVVVGANSVIKGVLSKNCIYVGSPCKLVKSRTQNSEL